MDLSLVLQKLAIATGLGLLVGLQRQRVQSPLAGIRTFALITLLGAVCALAAEHWGSWIAGTGMLAVALMLVVGNLAAGKSSDVAPGVTTEIAALLMYAVGAYVVVGHTAAAVAVGGLVALLLHWKAPLHDFAARIGEADVTAIMRFVLVALVIYPILPDAAYGPYQVLNPQHIWLMVVLIVGVGLGGYVAYKLLGQRAGAVAAGVLGGLISSTAITVSYSRHARGPGEAHRWSALVIVIASAVASARVIGEVAVVAPEALGAMAPPLLAMLGATTACALLLFSVVRAAKSELPAQSNPAELRTPLYFAGLYALMLLAVAVVRDAFGPQALFAVAALSGIHDLDAITLSTARFVDQQKLGADLGWRLILAANLSNLATKGLLAMLLGPRRLWGWVLAPLAAALAAGAAILWYWPSPPSG